MWRQLAAAAFFVTIASTARGATIEVDTTLDQNSASADDGSCSLREAVIAANTNVAVDGCEAGEPAPVRDEIRVPPGTYFLTIPSASFESFAETGDLDVRELVHVHGASAEETIIDLAMLPLNGSFYGDSGGFDGQLAEFSLADMTIRNGFGASAVSTLRDVTIDRLWIHSGFSSEGGAARVGDGVLTLRESTLSDNQAWYGGGVMVREGATARIVNTSILDNRACFGGGLFAVFSGEIELVETTVAGNTVGQLSATPQMCNGTGATAINLGGGTAALTNSIIEGDCSRPTAGSRRRAPSGTFTTGGGNVESPGDTCSLGGNDLVGVTEQALALGERAGPAPPVRRPLAGSVAIDSGVDLLEPLIDERGFPRPADGDGDEDAAFDAGAVEVQPFSLDAFSPPDLLELCGTLLVTGIDIRPDSVAKVFIATSEGTVDVLPQGLAGEDVTPTSFSATLPCPWPKSGYLLGQGFASVQLVSPSDGYATTPAIGIPIVGGAASGAPALWTIDGAFLADSSWDPTIGVANVERVIIPGASIVLEGAEFQAPVVNLFSASGNCGPLAPTIQSASQLTVQVPANCPTGPGSFQVVNTTNYRASNAVSVVIGAQPTISSIQVSGDVVSVTGIGFSPLTVPAFFAFSQTTTELTNYGGFDESGESLISVTFVSETEIELPVPADAAAGPAYLILLNPPFIPFSSSGTGPSGSFTLP